jgi:hypothetical protein
MRVDRRLPALSSFRGQMQAHEIKWSLDVDKQERYSPDDGGTRPENKFQGNTNAARVDRAYSKSGCP